MATQTQMKAQECTWRKTQAGAWVVFGPADVVRAGATVNVRTKAGAVKSETIERVGRPFEAGGKTMVYGYPAAKAREDSRHKSGGWQQATDLDDDMCPTDGNCLSFPPYRPCRYCG